MQIDNELRYPGTESPYDKQYFAKSHAGASLTVGVIRDAPKMIDVDIFATEGESFAIDILMQASAQGTAKCQLAASRPVE